MRRLAVGSLPPCGFWKISRNFRFSMQHLRATHIHIINHTHMHKKLDRAWFSSPNLDLLIPLTAPKHSDFTLPNYAERNWTTNPLLLSQNSINGVLITLNYTKTKLSLKSYKISIHDHLWAAFQPPVAVHSTRVSSTLPYSSQKLSLAKIKFNLGFPRFEPTTMPMPSQC